MTAPGGTPGQVPTAGFTASRVQFDSMVGFLDGTESGRLSHAELEERLDIEGRSLLRQLLQDHLDLRGIRERRVEVLDADGLARTRMETGHTRGLATVFGPVTVSRLAYREPAQPNLHPGDGLLNLPLEKHSHGLRALAAIEASRGSFDSAANAVERVTGQRLGKRQLEELAARAAADFDAFYTDRTPPPGDLLDLLVLSCDGKGVVMRHDALRPGTAKAAANSNPKLETRLSKGEKRNRKRIAEVAAVYDAAPAPRTPADILPGTATERADATPGPVARNKWLTASVVHDAAAVVAQMFTEADRRDPRGQRTWVALVDGNNHQIARIQAEARARDLPVSIVIDFVHVVEYLWRAAWCFHVEGNPAAEKWVRRHAYAVLAGRATRVAGAIRRQATTEGLDPAKRAGADAAATYLTNKQRYLDYPTALTKGWPIATGVIEGACRHLVKDRMDITGARWGLPGAEAILKLRAIRSNGNWDDYWTYHLTQEQQRVHKSRYAANQIPQAA